MKTLKPCVDMLGLSFDQFSRRNWSNIDRNIDPQQFGCLKGSSTTCCFLDMLHSWLSHLDSASQYIHLCFLDFSKAFDRIGHNVLIEKRLDIGVRRSLIPWTVC